MIIEQFAVLLYGGLAVVAALVAASIAGSVNAAGLVFLSAGLIYLFQVVQLVNSEHKLLIPLWVVSVGLLCASVFVSVFGA